LGEHFDRLSLLDRSSLLLLFWMMSHMDLRAQVHFHPNEHYALTGLSRATAYRSLTHLRQAALVAQTFPYCWQINPRLVHCADRKKWKYARHVFDTMILRKNEAKDEQSDLQNRSGQADDHASDPVAQP
jgi:hypothetical protein